jgi:hypothetical protein
MEFKLRATMIRKGTKSQQPQVTERGPDMPIELDQLCMNTIRMLAADGVEKAKSGHPGMPMGAALMAYVLWSRFLRHNPKNPQWPNRERFMLSAGHPSGGHDKAEGHLYIYP